MNHVERMNATFRACEGIEDAILEDRKYRIKDELDSLDDQIMLRLVAEREVLSLAMTLESLGKKSLGFLNAVAIGGPLESSECLLRAELALARTVLAEHEKKKEKKA